jgi:hypothetical protein
MRRVSAGFGNVKNAANAFFYGRCAQLSRLGGGAQ